MTIAAIQAALESRLNGISPALATAWPNVAYEPIVGTPWQRVRLFVNDPVDHAISLDITEQRGFLEVLLHYPLGVGAAAANARATAVATRFAPPQTLSLGGTNVEILSTPHIAGGFPIDNWWVVPITVPWRSFS